MAGVYKQFFKQQAELKRSGSFAMEKLEPRVLFSGVVQYIGGWSGDFTSDLSGIASAPDGTVWSTMQWNEIEKTTPQGQSTVFHTPSGMLISGLTVGQDGSAWVTEYNPGSPQGMIARITESGQVTEYSLNSLAVVQALGSSGIAMPSGITTAPDGSVWFALSLDTLGPGVPSLSGPNNPVITTSSESLVRVDANGNMTAFALPSDAYTGNTSIAATSDGAIWFRTNGGLGRLNTDGTITEFNIAAPPPNTGIIFPGVGDPTPEKLVADPNGGVWILETTGNYIGHVSNQGQVSYYQTPLGEVEDLSIANDGSVWMSGVGGLLQMTLNGGTASFNTYGILQSGEILVSAGPNGVLNFGWNTAWNSPGSTNSEMEIGQLTFVNFPPVPTEPPPTIQPPPSSDPPPSNQPPPTNDPPVSTPLPPSSDPPVQITPPVEIVPLPQPGEQMQPPATISHFRLPADRIATAVVPSPAPGLSPFSSTLIAAQVTDAGLLSPANGVLSADDLKLLAD